MSYHKPDYVIIKERNYGCMAFLLDCILLVITGGLWAIWIFVREMRRR